MQQLPRFSLNRIAGVTVLALALSTAHAQTAPADQDHAQHHPEWQQAPTAQNPATTLPPPVPHAPGTPGIGPRGQSGMMPMMSDQMLRERQEHMLQMHEMMHKIERARGAERERLMAEQRQMMRTHMQEMHQEIQQMRSTMGGARRGMGPGMQQDMPMRPLPPQGGSGANPPMPMSQ